MRKNQRPNQVNDPWYIPAVPTGKSDVGAPNCPVRVLRYYHRYVTEHPELRKGRRCLFIPIKDNKAVIRPEGGPAEASSRPPALETSVRKLTVYTRLVWSWPQEFSVCGTFIWLPPWSQNRQTALP